MPDINGIPYVESTDLVSGWPTVSQSVAQEVSDQLASKADYPSGGTDGDMLTKSGTTTAWAAPSGGVTLLDTATPSASSAVSVNGCFSATYTNYLIIAQIQHSTSNTGLLLRLRASGSDATGANYDSQRVYGASSSTVAVSSTGDTSYRTLAIGTVAGYGQIWLHQPFSAAATFITSSGGRSGHAEINSGLHDVATSYDGITFFASSGTITGTIKIYGYKD